jgi:glycerol-3-phosphate dehydrogenase
LTNDNRESTALLMQSFSSADRTRWLEACADEVLDVLVIGGGITGAGIARELALRGARCLVVDRGDFASGTSSRSSKLIHGGLRYLAQGDVALVREAARERAVLHFLAPHLARAVPMMIPTSSRASRLKMQAGLWSFDKLAGEAAGGYKVLDQERTLAAEPGLHPDRVAGGVVFHEYLTDDARLVLETLRSAADAGAMAANYAEVTAVCNDEVGLRATVEDREGGSSLEIRARVIVNASGPWFDKVRGLTNADAQPMTQLTRGIHLVVPSEALAVSHIVVLRSPDGRSTFVVPKGDVAYIGTTDSHYTGDPSEPGVSAADAGYLLESARATFVNAPTGSDIIGCWSGVRPLLGQPGKAPSEISRRDEIVEGPGPVVGVAGGKLTTYRRMSERVAEKVFGLLGRGADSAVDSAKLPLVGGSAEQQEQGRLADRSESDARLRARLWAEYGIGAAALLAGIEADPAGAEALGGLSSYTLAEARFAVDHEMALSVDDLLRRRSRAAMFNGPAAIAAASDAAALLASLLGWDEKRQQHEATTLPQLVATELATVQQA